ncbi:unnamed protein product [Ilex paraguariensis]|uniref:Uncharacterized protein n=1 Tax=Ilex paraguariensis TaxID=185542 RepID=A0ABC8UM44_9AQUA
MGGRKLQGFGNNGDGSFPNSGIGFLWCRQDDSFHPGGLFASVGQIGMGFGISPNTPNSTENSLKLPSSNLYSPGGLFASVGQIGMGFGISPNTPNPTDNALKLPSSNLYTPYMSLPEPSFPIVGVPELVTGEEWEVEEEGVLKKRKKKGGLKLKIKIGNPSLRRLISGAIAGAVSRTSVAPLETIRTHLMVGSCGHSMSEVFQNIMKTEGWTGLFRGNLVNVIRVAPSKAIEVSEIPILFAKLFDVTLVYCEGWL